MPATIQAELRLVNATGAPGLMGGGGGGGSALDDKEIKESLKSMGRFFNRPQNMFGGGGGGSLFGTLGDIGKVITGSMLGQAAIAALTGMSAGTVATIVGAVVGTTAVALLLKTLIDHINTLGGNGGTPLSDPDNPLQISTPLSDVDPYREGDMMSVETDWRRNQSAGGGIYSINGYGQESTYDSFAYENGQPSNWPVPPGGEISGPNMGGNSTPSPQEMRSAKIREEILSITEDQMITEEEGYRLLQLRLETEDALLSTVNEIQDRQELGLEVLESSQMVYSEQADNLSFINSLLGDQKADIDAVTAAQGMFNGELKETARLIKQIENARNRDVAAAINAGASYSIDGYEGEWTGRVVEVPGLNGGNPVAISVRPVPGS